MITYLCIYYAARTHSHHTICRKYKYCIIRIKYIYFIVTKHSTYHCFMMSHNGTILWKSTLQSVVLYIKRIGFTEKNEIYLWQLFPTKTGPIQSRVISPIYSYRHNVSCCCHGFSNISYYIYLPLIEINLQGSFRLCNWLSLRRLMLWINHLPPACWSTFWKSIFKEQLDCRFDE